VGVAVGNDGRGRLRQKQFFRGGIPHAARRRHGAQPFAGKPGFPQGVQIALTALGDKCLIVAFAQQRNALMAFSISQRVA
jgi:hypothetical protein